MPTSVRIDPVLFDNDSLFQRHFQRDVAINHAGVIVRFNHSAERTFQILADQALGLPILDVLPNTGGKLLESLNTGEAFPGYKLTGEYVTLMANISPVFRTIGSWGRCPCFRS